MVLLDTFRLLSPLEDKEPLRELNAPPPETAKSPPFRAW